ncbi:hypothetical protein [Colwellia sp. 20A7]|uniref:hypothetical protein n=1 Tax=Colwellia sp. 20A7 TaxID=2689569 RepID=UPI00135BEEB5|nr:hypothetical protein [Colwellia sp. 20A7]
MILITLSLMLSNSVYAKICMDDPRMFTIKTILEQATDGTSYKPMKLTPTTFLMLTPPTRKALGDNIVVYNDECIPQQIFKGQLPRKIEMPYEDLSYALHMSLIQNDAKTANVIFNSFVSAPKTASEIVPMIYALEWHNKAIENLYSQGMLEKRGMSYLGTNANKKRLCESTLSHLTHLELFTALGGKTTEQDITTVELESTHISLQARNSSVYTERFQTMDKSEEVTCNPYNVNRILSSIKTANIDLQEVRLLQYSPGFFKDYDKMKKAKQAASSSGI